MKKLTLALVMLAVSALPVFAAKTNYVVTAIVATNATASSIAITNAAENAGCRFLIFSVNGGNAYVAFNAPATTNGPVVLDGTSFSFLSPGNCLSGYVSVRAQTNTPGVVKVHVWEDR